MDEGTALSNGYDRVGCKRALSTFATGCRLGCDTGSGGEAMRQIPHVLRWCVYDVAVFAAAA